MTKEAKFTTVSIPTAITNEIDRLIEALMYWPSRSAFVREACLEKIRLEKNRQVKPASQIEPQPVQA